MQPAEPLPAGIKLFGESVTREIEALLRVPLSARANPAPVAMSAAAQALTEEVDAALGEPADPLISSVEEPAASGESGDGLPAAVPAADRSVPSVEEGTPAPPAETRAGGTSDRDLLLHLANRVRTIRAADGRFYAAVTLDGRVEYYRLESGEFRRYLLRLYHETTGTYPGQIAIAKVLAGLQSRAEITNRVESVFLRVAKDASGKGFLIDLGDPERRAVHVTEAGWEVVDNPGVPFWRPPGQRAFPTPVRGSSIKELRVFMNLAPDQWPLVVGWLTAALRPLGPYPLLVITGEQGSAKSTLAQVCRRLVDPSDGLLRALPNTQRDLMVSAHNNWLLAYDNISSLRPWQSDALCRLSSGGGFAARSLYSDDRETILTAQRPAILNGIDEFVTRGDLIDRSIFLSLPRILTTKRCSDRGFWALFDHEYPSLFGALLDAIAGGIRLSPEVCLGAHSRMADIDRWGEAVCRGLGWPAGTFVDAYYANRRSACAGLLEEVPVVAALTAMLAIQRVFEETPTELLRHLSEYRPESALGATWPSSPWALSKLLRRLAPQLRETGIVVAFTQGHLGRKVTVGRIREVGQNAPQ